MMLSSQLNRREVKHMVFASTSVITFAIGITAVLMIANWFIWGLNNPRDLRHPSTVTPLKGKEIVEMALRRLVAANEAVLPRNTAAAAAPRVSASDNGDNGFKRVA
jgi:hypothetical protein